MYTIYDVASEAGVSTATVSRVLSGKANVRNATKERVLAAIEKLDFHPNIIGQALNRGAGMAILMIVPLTSTPVLSSCIRAVAEKLKETPYKLLMGYYESGSSNVLEPQRDLIGSDLIRGIIFLDTNGTIPSFNKPTVVISEQPSCPYPYCVVSNDRKAVSIMTESLINRGVSRFAYIGMSNKAVRKETDYSTERFKGVTDALEGHGLQFDKQNYYECVYTSECSDDYYIYTAAAKAAEKIALLPESRRPEAVICATDVIAYACLDVFKRHGLKVPEDIRVAGYDNSSLSMIASPQITTIQSPFGEFGTEASRLMISILESGSTGQDNTQNKADTHDAVRITIDPSVCFRESTGR